MGGIWMGQSDRPSAATDMGARHGRVSGGSPGLPPGRDQPMRVMTRDDLNPAAARAESTGS